MNELKSIPKFAGKELTNSVKKQDGRSKMSVNKLSNNLYGINGIHLGARDANCTPLICK